MEKIFYKLLLLALSLLLFLIPFFFLNFTQEFFVTSKLYLLGYGVLLLLFISTIEILVTKKISWEKRPFDNLILLFISTIAISIIFSSPNKIQALLNPHFGLVMVISLAVLYFYLSRSAQSASFKVLSVSSILLSIITIIFFFHPFKNINLPQSFTFFKNPGFSPIGSQLDLAIFLGFFVILGIIRVVLNNPQPEPDRLRKPNSLIIDFSLLTFNLLALFLTLYSLLRPSANQLQPNLILSPFRLSWFAALEVLKNPQTAIIGVGPDNFSAIFTRVKDFAYNQSPLWQINSFNVSHSAILQILTETGILGLLAFGLLVFNAIKSSLKGDHKGLPLQIIYLFVYLIICLLIFPPSLIIWFLFFVVLSQLSHTDVINQVSTVDLPDLLPFYIGTVMITFGIITTSGYFLGRSYGSEYYFKKSIDSINADNVKQIYDNQRQAIILNPYIERFRINFAQANLIIANNIAQKKSKEITEQDRQTITQAVQAGISEAKAVVSLNPQKAENWQNLAQIYLNIINAIKGADTWTISAYQRAILADPQNPVYQVGLGGVYYSLNRYNEALSFFERAISLKPDWPNANYNYAWANFQKENYSQAVNAMQNTLNLLNQKTNKSDYEKVRKELEEFKKKLPKEDSSTNESDNQTGVSNLNLPTPPTTKISPKIELPKEASPEAK